MLPYREIEQSGVLYTALAFGKPIVASAVGGFTEVGERDGAAAAGPSGDPAAARRGARRAARRSRSARAALAPAAAAAATGPVLVGRHRRAAPSTSTAPLSPDNRGDGGRSRSSSGSAAGLLVYTHVGYPLVLALARPPAPRPPRPPRSPSCRAVSLIVAAHDEEEVIEAKVANALALDYPRELLELIVASDGSRRPHRRARPRGRAPTSCSSSRGRARSRPRTPPPSARSGELLAFSDANATWEPDALRELVAPFADPAVGYVCGQARLLDQGGSNQEGAYWRYELAVRELESALAGVTAGNGAIYAVRARPTCALGPAASHDLSFPFMLTKRGWRAVYAPAAVSEEKMVATIEGEFARKRRMMRGALRRGRPRRDARPARLRRRCTRSRSPATGCCATPRRSCT